MGGQEMAICRWGEAGEAFQDLFGDLRGLSRPQGFSGLSAAQLWRLLVCSWTLSSDLQHSQSAARPGTPGCCCPQHGWWVMSPSSTALPAPGLVQLLPLQSPSTLVQRQPELQGTPGAVLGGPTGSDWSNWGTAQPPLGEQPG